MNLYQEDLDFLEEAKRAFSENERLETYRDKEDEYIALRYGYERDCVQIYKLDRNVLLACNVMTPARQLIVDDK